jgi:hypothetical protein
MGDLTTNTDQLALEDIIRVSGSTALTRNDYGVTIVDSEDFRTSLIYKNLIKDKYDIAELQKAVNLEIKELKPNIPSQRKDLIPKPLYDEQVSLNADLRLLVQTLNATVADLNSTISGLQTEVDSEKNNRLNIELTNDSLVNQLDALSSTVDDFGQQLSTAIQKSIEESILRTSLQSQNDGFRAQINTLIKQIDSLNAIIEGLQAQLGALQQQKIIEDSASSVAFAAGGKVINHVVSAILTTRLDVNNIYDIFGEMKASNDNFRWKNGGGIKLQNADKSPVYINIQFHSIIGGDWLVPSVTSINLDPQQSYTVNLTLKGTAETGGLDSKHNDGIFGGWSGTPQSPWYNGGTLTISAQRADGSAENPAIYTCGFNKINPGSWG